MTRQMTTPTTVWRTAVRTTTVVAVTAGLLTLGVVSAQAADTPDPLAVVPAPLSNASGVVNQLLTNASGVVNQLLANPSGTVSSILPDGILGG
ncbi:MULTISPECIES: hypothetical protein [unclassified Streptomyces]|uniref:hypothetical protein n=1 Tax=unclassified Streptomyces TaxID=2593676 RepID=UPI002253098A|nr:MULTISPECIES: hypothetical protein [unclassified Streptomyces]MCX4989879.1 hypothetical protein [Streptomyces sp. NBC_00568]MCX5004898.1 hypothetical protein [Streptomyces sp. NBC_00638]